MDRLRTILILRGVFAAFFVAVGIVLLAGGDTVFGLFAVGVAITNAVLIGIVVRRSRRPGTDPTLRG